MTQPHVSLGQLAAQGADIRFVCSDCGASVIAPMEQVLRRFGHDTFIADIQARAVCKHCGNIEVVVRSAIQVAA
jgi:hypothetical protein